jgi:hypothetical protein
MEGNKEIKTTGAALRADQTFKAAQLFWAMSPENVRKKRIVLF